MLTWIKGSPYQLRVLESAEEMVAIGELRRIIWSGNETDVVPIHILITFAHNGGLVIGAYQLPSETTEGKKSAHELIANEDIPLPPASRMIGFVYGFPGLYKTADNLQVKHCSHELGVLPEMRDRGIGFALKRAQWQLVRSQGIDRITWTFDPLQSRNAYLNIARLGTVCNTYIREIYGELTDDLNAGVPTDRFQVDWWVNSHRVNRRLSKRSRRKLDLAHFLAADAEIINPTKAGADGFSTPISTDVPPDLEAGWEPGNGPPIILLEIPADISAIKATDIELAVTWRVHTRTLFERLFELGYLVTDFIFMPGSSPRSFYVLIDGETTL